MHVRKMLCVKTGTVTTGNGTWKRRILTGTIHVAETIIITLTEEMTMNMMDRERDVDEEAVLVVVVVVVVVLVVVLVVVEGQEDVAVNIKIFLIHLLQL